jgi:hypothetical protein
VMQRLVVVGAEFAATAVVGGIDCRVNGSSVPQE